MEEEIDNAIDYENRNKEKIPVDSFIIAMKRFIQRVLQIENYENYKEYHKLYDILLICLLIFGIIIYTMIAPSDATFLSLTSPTQPTRTRNKGKKVIGKFDVM
ncbi:unnamed protein product [Rhizophagus irregularis]|nr:unnamed protein product [Rhizophagus irregularis]